MDKLKPCPFCGAEAIIHEAEDMPDFVRRKSEIPQKARLINMTEYPDGHKAYKFRMPVYIPQCSDPACMGRTVKRFKTEAEAAEAWNRRAHED